MMPSRVEVCPKKFRGRLSFWQGTDIIQVLRCTLYAGVLELFRMMPSRVEVCPKKFRGRLSFWQGTDIIQVLRCTLYAEVLKL